MSRSHPLALVLAAALTAALAPAALASPAAPAKADVARAEHDRIVAYWTPERMKAAKPRDFVRQKDGSFRLAPTPKAKPGGGGTTTNAVPLTAGASWTGQGEVLARTGKVYFRMGTLGYVCSGAVADDGSTGNEFSLVLTAGHCVNDQSKADGGGWATEWMFIPDFDSKPNLNTTSCNSADTAYGCWTAGALVAHDGFTKAGGFTTAATRHDYAFAVVGKGGKSGGAQLDATVQGGYPLTTGIVRGSRLSAFGYPAAGKYTGNDLTYCSGTITTDSYNGITGVTDNWGLPCGMTGGSSGGPWLVTETTADGSTATLNAKGNGGSLASLNSYGYSGVRYMFGPVFDAETLKVLVTAKAGPQTSVSVS